MRSLFAIAALLVTGTSMTLDFLHPAIDSRACREGLCRYDQALAAVDAHGIDLAGISALLEMDPSNPLVWSTYAELVSAGGRPGDAAPAFAQAIALGPGMSPVLMRAANFDFAQGRLEDASKLTNRILTQTDAFDQVLFSYLTRSGLPVSELAGTAVPAEPRPARSWFFWLRRYGTSADLHELWPWMRRNKLADQPLAVEFAWTFWKRDEFWAAHDLWADWLGPAREGGLRSGRMNPERLANGGFESAPSGSPFDWIIDAPSQSGPAAGLDIRREDGLEIQFPGTGNVDFSNVRQFTTVSGGRYRFAVEWSARDITTDQGPFFRITDAQNPARWSVETPRLTGTVARSEMRLDVSLPPGTQALKIQIERRPSESFDNKIGGSLHIYRVSLKRLAHDAIGH